MIITEMTPLLGDSGYAFHSRIVLSAITTHKDRSAGIRRIFGQEIPAILSLIDSFAAARQLEETRGVSPAELDLIPIFTEAEVLLSGAANTSYYPLLNAKAEQMRKERHEIAQALVMEKNRLKNIVANITAVEVESYRRRVKAAEITLNHDDLDTLWLFLNNEITRIRIVLNSLTTVGPEFAGVSV